QLKGDRKRKSGGKAVLSASCDHKILLMSEELINSTDKSRKFVDWSKPSSSDKP
ncbi:hypothetical protein J6590_104707, partial [Homalodisca vitripennis]